MTETEADFGTHSTPLEITVAAIEEALEPARGAGLFPRNLLNQGSLPALQESLEREFVLHHLQRLGRDTTALSRFLGLSRQQLYRRLRRLGIRLREKGRQESDR